MKSIHTGEGGLMAVHDTEVWYTLVTKELLTMGRAAPTQHTISKGTPHWLWAAP